MESATTELTRLPGLEVAETKPELKPEHWIERGPSKRLMLFSGRSHPERGPWGSHRPGAIVAARGETDDDSRTGLPTARAGVVEGRQGLAR